MSDDIVDLAKFRGVPEIRKKAPGEKVIKLEFKIFTEPTFNEESGEILNPPHWEFLQGEDKLGWGPIETAPMMWRFFCILAIAQQLIPTQVIEDNLRAMQAQMPTGGAPDAKAN